MMQRAGEPGRVVNAVRPSVRAPQGGALGVYRTETRLCSLPTQLLIKHDHVTYIHSKVFGGVLWI